MRLALVLELEGELGYVAGVEGEDAERHPERFEHFGISVVEAMAAGAVPLVFGAAGPGEIVQDGDTLSVTFSGGRSKDGSSTAGGGVITPTFLVDGTAASAAGKRPRGGIGAFIAQPTAMQNRTAATQYSGTWYQVP